METRRKYSYPAGLIHLVSLLHASFVCVVGIDLIIILTLLVQVCFRCFSFIGSVWQECRPLETVSSKVNPRSILTMAVLLHMVVKVQRDSQGAASAASPSYNLIKQPTSVQIEIDFTASLFSLAEALS